MAVGVGRVPIDKIGRWCLDLARLILSGTGRRRRTGGLVQGPENGLIYEQGIEPGKYLAGEVRAIVITKHNLLL